MHWASSVLGISLFLGLSYTSLDLRGVQVITVIRQNNSSFKNIISCYCCLVSVFQHKWIEIVEVRLGCGGLACSITHFIAAPGLLEVNKDYFGFYEVQCSQAEMALQCV